MAAWSGEEAELCPDDRKHFNKYDLVEMRIYGDVYGVRDGMSVAQTKKGD